MEIGITQDLRQIQLGHVLFLEIVGFSYQSPGAQRSMQEGINDALAASVTLAGARQRQQALVLSLPGLTALIFLDDLIGPVRGALELLRFLTSRELAASVRIGLHCGVVHPHLDDTGDEFLTGEGINTARQVMGCGDVGHILLSGEYARQLQEVEDWKRSIVGVGPALLANGRSVELFVLHKDGIGRVNPPQACTEKPPVAKVAAAAAGVDDVVLLYRQRERPDEDVLELLAAELTRRGLRVYCDRSAVHDGGALREHERRLRSARAVVPIISPRALRSDFLRHALEDALEERQQNNRPAVLPVQVGPSESIEYDDLAIQDLVAPFPYLRWGGPGDNHRVIAGIISALHEPIPEREIPLEIVGGGMNPESPFYVERKADARLHQLIDRCHSIVLVRGGRQIGKTSLLARGIHRLRASGKRFVRTDFQKVPAESLKDPSVFYRYLGVQLARQCSFSYDMARLQDKEAVPSQNFEYFLHSLLEADTGPLVWFMDEVDKVFPASFASDFFGLVRSWHNDRSADPFGPMQQLTIVIAYATEAHLFIRQLDQSPFNVGELVQLEDFSPEQVLQLNELYGGPIGAREDIERLQQLLGGQPFLTRLALDSLARLHEGFPTLMRDAARDDGPFRDHLKRVLASITALESVTTFVRSVLAGTATREQDRDAYYRLLRAGILQEERDGKIGLRCQLYQDYLTRHLGM